MTEARSPNLLALLSTAAKTAAGISYLLPWLNIMVGSRLVVSATGLNLATGEIAMRVPILGTVETRDGPLALPLILAQIFIVASIGASLIAERRRGALAGLILSGLALALIAGFVAYGFYISMPLPAEQMNLIERLADTIVRQIVHVRSGLGFWVALIALVAGMMLDTANMRSDGTPDQSD